MFKGIHSTIGVGLINKGISDFEDITKDLEKGIAHCQTDIDKHTLTIAESHAKIGELNQHVDKARIVVQKVKNLFEEP